MKRAIVSAILGLTALYTVVFSIINTEVSTEEIVLWTEIPKTTEKETINVSEVHVPEVENTPQPSIIQTVYRREDFLEYAILEEPLEQDPKKRSTREICDEVAAMYPQISSADLQAMCIEESGCDPEAFNGADKGITQVNKKWHKERMQRLNVTNLTDPYSCILTTADFLNELYDIAWEKDYVNGDFAYVLMRYNMAIDAAEYWYQQGVISEYAQEVLDMAQDIRELQGDD